MTQKPSVKLVLGGPGCGKTTRLLQIVEEELLNGVPGRRIAYVAFTRAAAHEAAARAGAKFNMAPDDLPWFRTIHSLVYAQLGTQRDDLVGKRELKALADTLHLPWVETDLTEMSDLTMPGGDVDELPLMLRICEHAVTTGRTLEATWRALNEAVPWHQLKQFDDTYAALKGEIGKMDFTDLLRVYAQGEGEPVPVDVAIIDEAQDLTPLQWAVVHRAFGSAARWYVAGDDDQAIYTWAGADLDRFLNISPDPEVLPLSYRLTSEMLELASGLTSGIRRRYAKPFTARRSDPTSIQHHMIPEVPLDEYPRDASWLVLARNTYLMRRWIAIIRDQGLPYTVRGVSALDPDHLTAIRAWMKGCKMELLTAAEVRLLYKMCKKDPPQLRENQQYTLLGAGLIPVPWQSAFTALSPSRVAYYTSCLSSWYDLDAPSIRIDTIHGVKGMEADHVLLCTDMSYRTYSAMRKDPDNEARVWYVGATRARTMLHIVAPTSDMAFSF
jgi:DNA helicase-2/ATP-dependent DNA helicase PcrA